MNRLMKFAAVPCMLTALSLSSAAFAQDRPAPPAGPDTNQAGPPDGGPQNGPPPDREPVRSPQGGPQDGPQHDGDRGPGGGDHGQNGGGDRDGQHPQRGPGGHDGQGAPAGASGTSDVMRYQGYLNMVAQYSKLASDPDSAGVAAVVSASDVLRRTGPQSAIDYFTKVLPDVKSDAVRRAIRLQLVDLYKAVKDDVKALDQLKTLITADSASSSTSSMPALAK